jgi:hypothetical protein
MNLSVFKSEIAMKSYGWATGVLILYFFSEMMAYGAFSVGIGYGLCYLQKRSN